MKKSAKALEYGGYAFALILAITIRLTGASDGGLPASWFSSSLGVGISAS